MASRHPAFILSASLLVAAALALSACAQGVIQASQTPAAAAAQPAPTTQPAQAAAAAPQAEAEPAEPVTQERASATCWMTYESRRGLSLDARMKLVDACIDARMKAGH
jgi:hypothetical protein